MSKVYVVSSGEYSDYQIRGIFSTFEKACEFVETGKRDSTHDGGNAWKYEHVEIEEHGLDEPIENVHAVYSAHISLKDGALVREHARNEWGTPESNSWVYGDEAGGKSCKSSAHALKLAAEARQKWLRTGGCE